jgi:hypothetical protein
LRMAALGTMPPFGADRANWPPGPPPVHAKYAEQIGVLSRCVGTP